MVARSGMERVRAWRQEEGVSAAELGEQIDKSGSLVLKMETGVETVTLGVALVLAKVTGVPLRSLLKPALVRDVIRAHAELVA